MKKIILSFIFLLASGVLLNAQQSDATTTNTNGPEISFENVTHDYGTITVGANGEYEFEFTNSGNEPLILSQPRSSCGCTVPAWPRKPVLPGEKEKIKVTYNTAIKGRFQKTVTVMSNATTNKSVVLTIKGEVMAKPTEAMPEKSASVNTSSPSK